MLLASCKFATIGAWLRKLNNNTLGATKEPIYEAHGGLSLALTMGFLLLPWYAVFILGATPVDVCGAHHEQT